MHDLQQHGSRGMQASAPHEAVGCAVLAVLLQVKLVGTCLAKPAPAAPKSKLTADQRLKRVMQQVAATSGRPKAAAGGDAAEGGSVPGQARGAGAMLPPAAVAGALARGPQAGRAGAVSAVSRRGADTAASDQGTATGATARPSTASDSSRQAGAFKPPAPRVGGPPSKLALKRPTTAGRAELQTPRAQIVRQAPTAAAPGRADSPPSSEASFHSLGPSQAGSRPSSRNSFVSASARRSTLGLPRPGSVAGKQGRRAVDAACSD